MTTPGRSRASTALERIRAIPRPRGTALGAKPRVEFPLSHLLINCLVGAVLWAGIIALIAGGYSALRWALG